MENMYFGITIEIDSSSLLCGLRRRIYPEEALLVIFKLRAL